MSGALGFSIAVARTDLISQPPIVGASYAIGNGPRNLFFLTESTMLRDSGFKTIVCNREVGRRFGVPNAVKRPWQELGGPSSGAESESRLARISTQDRQR